MTLVKLTDVGKLSRGKSKHRPRNDAILYGGPYPFIQTSDIKKSNHILKNYSQTYSEFGLKQSKLWKKGTICITIAANIADTAILGLDACFPDSVLGLEIDKNKADVDYIEYLLQYYKKNIQLQSNGTSQENINIETFDKVLFDIPELSYQKSIAKVLSSIDEKIELNNKINSKLEQMAKTLYDYWFVQFEFPAGIKGAYKSSNGQMVYNEILKREIPVGWEVTTLNTLCNVKSGFPFSSDDYKINSKYKLITIKNVLDRYISVDTDNTIENIPLKMPDYCLLKEGNILISLTGNVGRVGMVFGKNLLLNQRVGILNLKNYKYHSYLYLLFLQNSFRTLLEKISTGSNQKNLSPIEVETQPIIIPPKNIMESFFNLTEPLLQKTIKNYQENHKLEELREFLLPLLMNGQIKVEQQKPDHS